jgi:MFS family permease
VAALAIAETASWGILHYGFGILLRPVANDLGVSEVVAAGAYSVALLAGGLAATPVGRALDRHGARLVMTAGAGVASVALLAFAGASGVTTLYLAWGLIGVTQAAVLYEPAFAAITSWFERERDRLRALQVVTIVAGLASTIVGPLIARASASFGWRITAVGMSAVLLLLVVPLHASLPATKRTTARPGADHDDVTQLSMVFAVHSFVSTGLAVHLVAHLVEGGVSLMKAAQLAGVMGVAQVGGRLAAASLRLLGSTSRLTLMFGAQGIALVAIASDHAVLGIVLFGLSNGLVTLERATLVAERFGRERYGENSGRIARVGMIARAGAPFGVGWARVHAGPTVAFAGLAALVALAAVTLNLPLARGRSVQ